LIYKVSLSLAVFCILLAKKNLLNLVAKVPNNIKKGEIINDCNDGKRGGNG
jgi:hypothetical protein